MSPEPQMPALIYLTNIGILKTFGTESSLHISITIDNLIIDHYTAII